MRFKAFYLTTFLVITSMGVADTLSAQPCLLSDEFDGIILAPDWQQYQPEYFDVQVKDGYLTMDIEGNQCGNDCPWFHSQSAGFIYKEVAGNFEVIAVVEAEEASGASMGQDIINDTQLGGLMARNGNSSTQNYVFNVVGKRFDVASIETKSTTNDNSGTIEHFPIPTTRAELRMTREGDTFRMYSRALGSTMWMHRSTFVRPDLPDTIQVGLIAYAFLSYPENLSLKIDYIRFEPLLNLNLWVGGDGLWSNANMWSLNQVPDSSHTITIDNLQQQTIQIQAGESFRCYGLEVTGGHTIFIVHGELEVISQKTCE